MADVHSRTQRSYNMSQIRNRDTKPELKVRSLIHSLGYRFRLHVSSLPGKPDIVLPRHRKVIEVRGCFFHSHDCRYGSVIPKTHKKFWKKKRLATVLRDKHNDKELTQMGWNVLTVWECETQDRESLKMMLETFLRFY